MSEQVSPPTANVAVRVPAVWGNVPQRNKNFTGREDLLQDLRRRVVGNLTAVLAHALHGMGGVGKTQLAAEYAHRFGHEYDVVWWVPADQMPLVRASLAGLAPRLGIEGIDATRLEDTVNAVHEALRRGEPYSTWLIIFDNADQPEEIKDLLPSGPGHVIVTSRNHRWQSQADTVEVDVFSRAESLQFLGRRVPGITPEDASRLADELGDLPLALEQAGALQVESGMSVDEYLKLLSKESSKVLAENPPADYPVGVAAAYSLSVDRLKQETPYAWELLRRCAFFGPEPIQISMLKRGRNVLGVPQQDEVDESILFSRAIRELGRYAMVRVDNYHKTLQVHRLIQKLLRDDMEAQDAEVMEHEVHQMLALSDPDDPDETERWLRYRDLLAQAGPSALVTCNQAGGRRLVRNLVRYLFSYGDLESCDTLSAQALGQWTADSGPDDRDVLILAGQRANLLWQKGLYAEAYELRRPTLERMRAALGEEHEETLVVTNDHGADLRSRGEFKEALELDDETLSGMSRVFGDDHPRTFMVANNVAVDQGLNGDYAAAYETDMRTHQERLNFYGRNDHLWVIHSLGSTGRDLRQAGKYYDALQIAQQAYEQFADLVRQRTVTATHPWVLWQAKDLSVARRKMGQLDGALTLAEDVYEKCEATFGSKHPDTLAAGMNLGNARRVYGDLTGKPDLLKQADAQVAEIFGLYGEVLGADHPYTHGCALNLAIVRRRVGDEDGARRLLEGALEGLERRLGDTHHYTLICRTALATSLSATGDVEAAREHGERALEGLTDVVGERHPHTLACATNLAIDLRALGVTDRSEQLGTDTALAYSEILPLDHLDVLDAQAGKRVALDFEPPPL